MLHGRNVLLLYDVFANELNPALFDVIDIISKEKQTRHYSSSGAASPLALAALMSATYFMRAAVVMLLGRSRGRPSKN